MTKEEIAKRFCKFELCTHRNGEGMCCLFNQDNCIFHRLEKENAELKEQNKWLEGCKSELAEHLGKANDRITELEKDLKDANEKVVHLACNQNKDLKYKLTKAKEIIRELLSWERRADYDYAEYDSIKDKAEQFLGVEPIDEEKDAWQKYYDFGR